MEENTSETKNMKIVVLGGTGLIGSKVVNLLRARGNEVVAASPSQGINSITGEGLTEALTGAQVVVDVTNSPSFEDKAVLEFFETSTRTVLAANLAKIAVAKPLNGTIEIAGPDAVPFDELVREYLVAHHDPRSVATDEQARYFGTMLEERSLVPGENALLGSCHFANWLSRTAAQR